MDKSKEYLQNTIAASLLLITFGLMYYVSINNYLLPHTFVELAGAVVSMTIFSIGWNTREYSKNNFMTVLSMGYLIVGILTAFHMLTYAGMKIFPEHGTNLPTQFWIATRYVESITKLVAFFYLNKKKEINFKLMLGSFLFICTIITASIFAGIFPDCFIEGKGLTSFKIFSEYIICGILIYSGYVLWKQQSKIAADVSKLIHASIAFTILSELSFTLYTDPYGFLNLLGHFFTILSTILIYFSLVQGNLTRPYLSLFKNVADYAEELASKNKELEVKDKAIASSMNAILLTDKNGYITYINETTRKLLGYETEEMLGCAVMDFLNTAEKVEMVKEQLKVYGNWYGEILLKKKDGSLMHGLLTANFIYSKEGDPICGMASFLDITERKNMEEELIRAKNDAEAANLAKSYFLANMSHEIRTTMNGILGFLQLLEITLTSKEQIEYINNIKISTETLLTVINDILDVSKIEFGKMELENIPFDFRLAIDNTVIPYKKIADEKGLELIILIRPDVPQFVKGDPTRLRQVISNLMGNAIKFTQKGFVLLEIGLKAKEETHVILQFTIKDTGIGISQEAIKKLFEPFTQADASSSRRFGGTGLGLTISKSIVKMMGGSIQVNSVVGKGTKFTFTISLIEEADVKLNMDVDYSILKGKRVMIIDGQTKNRNIIKRYLQEVGCMVTDFNNSRDAFSELIREENCIYNIVLVDRRILNMEGIGLLSALKTIPATKSLPTILLNATASDIDENELNDGGYSGYLPKLYRKNELLDCIVALLIEKREEEEAEEAFVTVTDTQEDDSNELEILLVEDNEVSIYFFVELLKMKGIQCDIAVDGEEAVNTCLRKNYDLVFMDCQMPVMDGYEATRKIREAEGDKRHTIIIAMTANAMMGDAEKCLNSGMDSYISKPVDINQVNAIIKKYSKNKAVKKHNTYYEDIVLRLRKEAGFFSNTADGLIEEGIGLIHILTHEAQNHIKNNNILETSATLQQIKGVAGNLRMIEIADMAVQADTALKAGSIEIVKSLLVKMRGLFKSIDDNNIK